MKSLLLFWLCIAAAILMLALLVDHGQTDRAERQCDAWAKQTHEQTRVSNRQCYVLERDQFVPIEQRQLDAEIQRQSQ